MNILGYNGSRNFLDVPQYQMILSTPAALEIEYRAGMLGYRLCAGRLIEPRMLPPCLLPISFTCFQKV